MLFLAHRKLFALVSCPTWLHGFPYPQETVRVWFPIRLGSMVFFTDRKLLAKGFLSALIPQCFLPTGNCSRRVSYSAWLHGFLYRQETVRREISGLRFAPLEMTKGLGSMVLLTHRKLFPLLPPEIVLLPRRLYFSILRLSIVWGRERCCFLNRRRKSS